jgi:nucleolar protein 4
LPFFKNIKCKILLWPFLYRIILPVMLVFGLQVVIRVGPRYDLTVFFSAESFGAERRPTVEFALEDVEKVRLQKIGKERRDKSKGGEDQEGPSGHQPASDGPRADKGKALRKGNKRKSHDRSSLPSSSGEGLAKDLSAAGGRSSREGIRNERPTKRARKSNMGTTLPGRDGKDATKNTTVKVNVVLFRC